MEKYTKISISLLIVLSLLSLLTHFQDSTDQGDYTDIAKYFTGNYAAKVRTSHSLLYGFIHSPMVKIFQSFTVMKITNIIFLLLIVASIYLLSDKNPKTLLLATISPIFWYLGPWITPIMPATLLSLWSIHFLRTLGYEKESWRNIKNLIYAGVLSGLAVSLWDGFLPFLVILIICFFYDQKINHLTVFILSILLGMSPLLILNQAYYGFAFYSQIKYALTISVFAVYGGFNGNVAPFFWQSYLAYILIIPFTAYLLFKKNYYLQNTKEINFLALSLLFVLITNPQIRYLMILWPLLLIHTAKNINEVQFKRQIAVFALVSILISAPYLVQIGYQTSYSELTRVLQNNGLTIGPLNDNLLENNFIELTKDYPNQTFVVGNADDDYQQLAHIYWGKDVNEFVSIQDYNLFMQNKSTIFEKTFSSNPLFPDRRQIWISGGIRRNLQDATDYGAIQLGIGVNEPISLKEFNLTKNYGQFYLSKRVSNQA